MKAIESCQSAIAFASCDGKGGHQIVPGTAPGSGVSEPSVPMSCHMAAIRSWANLSTCAVAWVHSYIVTDWTNLATSDLQYAR
jgi:hypothetical protein